MLSKFAMGAETVMAKQDRIALILGATGGIGGETAAALERHGWRIRALSRSGKPPGAQNNWEWVGGDATDKTSVVNASKGVSAIAHAVNPPGYKNWAQLVLPMIDNTVEAARESGARILLPGTIYNYGDDAFPVLREDSPQHATTHKGRIRIALEQRLENAAQDNVRSLIVCFGDFFGPKPGASWFSQVLVKAGKPIRSITYPGKKRVGHEWAYLPDAAETFALLLNREAELQTFARFHFRGHWDSDGMEMTSAIAKAVGKSKLPVKSMPWLLFKAASYFNETMRELYAVRPLWERPIELDNQKLVRLLGTEPHTPLDVAVRTSLKGIGCIQ